MGVAAISLLASLWFPWHVLPPGEVKLAWTHRAAAMLPPSVPVSPEVNHVLHAAWRGVYQQQSTATGLSRALLVLPAWRYQRATPAALAAAGWQVGRIGPYIHATRGDHGAGLLNPRSVLRATLAALITSRWPMYPGIIFEAASVQSVVSQPLAAVATPSGTTWRVVVDQSIAQPSPGLRPAGQPTVASNVPRRQPSQSELAAIVVVAPGSLWKSMPETLWDDILRPRLHFTRTRPPFVHTLATLPQATVLLSTQDQGSDVAITGEDPTGQFALAATTWLQEEERRSRLVNRAFRLPDGTQGYERVLGEALPVLSPPDEAGCRGPEGARTTLWLCQQGKRTTLATDRDLALRALAYTAPAPLTIHVTAAGLLSLQKNCPAATVAEQLLCTVRAISWQGSETFHVGEVEFNDL